MDDYEIKQHLQAAIKGMREADPAVRWRLSSRLDEMLDAAQNDGELSEFVKHHIVSAISHLRNMARG